MFYREFGKCEPTIYYFRLVMPGNRWRGGSLYQGTHHRNLLV